MKLSELENGETFIFNKHRFKKVRKLPSYDDVIECMDDNCRLRPFKGITEVEPDQRRIKL